MSTGILIGYRTASEVVGRLCSFAIILFAARALSTDHFGLFSLAWATGWIVSIAGDFGLQIHLTRAVSRRPDQSDQLFQRFLRLRLTLCGVLFLGACSITLFSGRPQPGVAFLLVVLSQVFGSLIDFHNHLYRGIRRSELESTLNLFARVSMLVLAGASLLIFKSLIALASAMALSNGLALLAAHAISRRVLAGTVREGPTIREQLHLDSSKLLRQILPIGLGILLSALYFRIDLFYLEHWHGNRSVGFYNAVFRLVDALRLIPAAVMAVIFPDLCLPGNWRALAYSLLGLFGLSLILAGGVYWQAPSIVELAYGRAYLVAVPAFGILLMSLPFLFVNFVLTHQLIGFNWERSFATLCAGGLVISVVLNFLIIPGQGMEGAAWVCLIREILLSAACLSLLFFRQTPDRRVPRAIETSLASGH